MVDRHDSSFECPNFFEMTEGKLCGQFDGDWDWVLRGIENYSKYVFDDI